MALETASDDTRDAQNLQAVKAQIDVLTADQDHFEATTTFIGQHNGAEQADQKALDEVDEFLQQLNHICSKVKQAEAHKDHTEGETGGQGAIDPESATLGDIPSSRSVNGHVSHNAMGQVVRQASSSMASYVPTHPARFHDAMRVQHTFTSIQARNTHRLPTRQRQVLSASTQTSEATRPPITRPNCLLQPDKQMVEDDCAGYLAFSEPGERSVGPKTSGKPGKKRRRKKRTPWTMNRFREDERVFEAASQTRNVWTFLDM